MSLLHRILLQQNKRGGRVKLDTILSTVMEFDHSEKGDTLYCKFPEFYRNTLYYSFQPFDWVGK